MNGSSKINKAKRLGIISDTHGLLRPEAADELQGCDLIIHAGDIGGIKILDELSKICRVVAVRGNIDDDLEYGGLKLNEIVSIGNFELLVVHNINDYKPDVIKRKIDAVIYGHSHIPSIEYRDEILFFNPGSAGRRRFKLPVSLGIITIQKNSLKPQLIELSAK